MEPVGAEETFTLPGDGDSSNLLTEHLGRLSGFPPKLPHLTFLLVDLFLLVDDDLKLFVTLLLLHTPVAELALRAIALDRMGVLLDDILRTTSPKHEEFGSSTTFDLSHLDVQHLSR